MINNIETYGFLQSGWHRTEITTTDTVQTIYQGKCSNGSGDGSAPIWCIKKVTITTVENVQTIVEQFADGDLRFDNVWADRASLTYKFLS